MKTQYTPPHPGAALREDVLPALGLSVTDAAAQLGVTRPELSRVLNEHAAISPEMARRIEAWLGADRGGRAEIWLGMQLDYDLWHARKRPAPKVKRAPAAIAFALHQPAKIKMRIRPWVVGQNAAVLSNAVT